MKKFFEEYGSVAIIVIVIAVLLLIVGSVKGLDEDTGKVNGSSVASMVGNKFSESIGKFQKSFMDVGVAKGPNGETLISKDESQVGKYADIDGDGTVDGIIFADLMIGGNGECGPNGYGKYTIPTISDCKDYYVSQESYTNKLGGTAEVLSPTGSGNSRFYIMALSNIDSNYHDWYNAAYGKMSDYASVTSQDFGKGKSNTATMISKWNAKAYGEQNTCSSGHTDMWGEIQTQANNGWFVPSRAEWAAFVKNLGITNSNYSSKGLSHYYWSSSQYNTGSAYYACVSKSFIRDDYVSDGNLWVRLAATF